MITPARQFAFFVSSHLPRKGYHGSCPNLRPEIRGGPRKRVVPKARADDTLRGGHEKILVAEDNEGLRNAAKEILETLGYQVVLAKDGAEAVRMFENIHDKIDLVFMDVVMPGLNGPEAYNQMCALLIKPNLPVLFTTGYATETNVAPTRLPVSAVILDKPYGMKALAQKLRTVLEWKSE